MFDIAANSMRVLVVDDEVSIADSLAEILRLRGHDAHSVYSGESAVDSLADFEPEVLVADVIMGGMNGIELANHVASRIPDCRVILFSGQADLSQTIAGPDLLSHGFTLYAKPIHPDVLLDLIESGDTEQPGVAMHVNSCQPRPPRSDTGSSLRGLGESERGAEPSA